MKTVQKVKLDISNGKTKLIAVNQYQESFVFNPPDTSNLKKITENHEITCFDKKKEKEIVILKEYEIIINKAGWEPKSLLYKIIDERDEVFYLFSIAEINENDELDIMVVLT